VLIIRGTKKFRDRMRVDAPAPDAVPTTALGAWYATILFWKPQVALLVNERTLHPLFMPFAPAATATARVADAVVPLLEAYAAPPEFIEREVQAMRECQLAPTESRSILGTMNEFGHMATRMRDLDRGSDLMDLSLKLGHTPCRMRGPAIWPDHEMRRVIGGER
jgi:hypothetical protein